jgi:hypothetical protein
MNLKNLFKDIKKSFFVQKKVDFDELGLHFIMEPLTTLEELKVLEACQATEGAVFLSELKRSSLAYGIRKINDLDFSDEIVEFEDDNGVTVKETKYLFLKKQIDVWPASLRDVLFDAFSDMQVEIDSVVKEKAKFKKFTINTIPEKVGKEEAGIPKGFKKVIEPDGESGNETDRLNQQVKKEQEQVEAQRIP